MMAEHSRAPDHQEPAALRRPGAAAATPADVVSARPSAGALDSMALLALQRNAGNAAVSRMMQRPDTDGPVGGHRRSGAPPGRTETAALQRVDTPADPAAPPDAAAPEAALVAAARSGDLPGVADILAKGGNVNEVDEFGATALIYAVDRNDLAMINLLFKNGADPQILSKETSEDGSKGETALKIAILNDNPGVAALLLDRGATMDGRDLSGNDAPIWAARAGAIGCLAVLIARGCDVNRRDQANLTLLHWAASSGRLAMVQWLLASGVDRTTIPAVIAQTRKTLGAYEFEGAQVSTRAPSRGPDRALEIAERDVRLAELKTATEAVARVLAYLESLPEASAAPGVAPR
jgi:Ankyrin repeats (3 copies)/Ankyrin repeats (many copies)